MTTAIIVTILVIACSVIVGRTIAARFPPQPVKRWVDVKFGWSVAAHANGRYIHVLPEGDGQVHTEDADGECRCGPTVNRFERTTGGDGWLIIHRTTPAKARR